MATTLRILRSTLAGAAAWWIGLNYIFGAAQPILASPALQSPKMNAIYEMLPPPRIATDPWLLPAAFLVCAFMQAGVFAAIRSALPRGLVARGAAFGAVAWALFVPWFEFYLPWSLMLEPTLLVLLELLCWAGVMLLAGLAISFGFGREGVQATAAGLRHRHP
ncbi:MAG TPA: hypothetical protein VF650_10045 [Allosphingosinicella sp.]|jgi:hypothetical protein